MESKQVDTSRIPGITQSVGNHAVGHCANCPWFPGMEMPDKAREPDIRHNPPEEPGFWLNIGNADEYSPHAARKN